MKLLITGANGFIGRHLVRHMATRGCSILAPVRGLRSTDIAGVTWIENADFSNVAHWRNPNMRGVDAVIHLAGHAHQTRETSEADRKVFFDVNVGLTERLFSEAASAGVTQFIFVSSIGAIKSTADEVVTESTIPSPSNAYGCSKHEAERTIVERANSASTRLTIVRPCLVFGPGNPGNMARLSRLIDTGVPLPFGSLRAKRSYLYIDNLATALEACLMNENAFGEDFNVCDDDPVALPQLVKAIAAAKGCRARLFPCHPRILQVAGHVGDRLTRISGKSLMIDTYSVERLVSALACDNSKIRNTLNWIPQVALEEALKRTFGGAQA